MKLFRREDEYSYDFLMSKCLRIFTDYGYFFVYIELPHYTLRFSPQAGSYIYNKKTQKYYWD